MTPRSDFHLIRPENQLPSRHPGLPATARTVLFVTPRGRQTTWAQAHVTLQAESTAETLGAGHEHFLYLLDGGLDVRTGDAGSFTASGHGAFVFVSTESRGFSLATGQGATFVWLQRIYAPLPGLPAPRSRAGSRDTTPLVRDQWLQGASERALIPTDDLAFDFTMKLLAFDAGISFDQVEIHDEDHGIYITEGGGTYLLGEVRTEVRADDFIYLGPYCPQHFEAGPASEYLLYKPANRVQFD